MTGYEGGALDALELCRLTVESAAHESDPVAYLRRRIETTELTLAFLASPSDREETVMALTDLIGGRRRSSPTVAQVAAQESAVQRARRDLEDLDEEYTKRREAAVGRLEDAERKLDGRRRALVGECAAAWRARAEELLVRAGRTDPSEMETRVIEIVRFMAPSEWAERTQPARDWLTAEAREAEQRAATLERHAAEPVTKETKGGLHRPARTITVGTTGEALGRLVASLEWPATPGGDNETEEARS